jgi:hypothetical protein
MPTLPSLDAAAFDAIENHFLAVEQIIRRHKCGSKTVAALENLQLRIVIEQNNLRSSAAAAAARRAQAAELRETKHERLRGITHLPRPLDNSGGMGVFL